MPRPEQPLNPSASPLQAFADGLRQLRRAAGNPTYRVLARKAGYSPASLSTAASGKILPSLEVTLAYVGACGGDEEEWRRRWYDVHATTFFLGGTDQERDEQSSGELDLVPPLDELMVPSGSGRVLDRLAQVVMDQWRAEDFAWLGGPRALPVRWTATSRPVSDHWEAILGADVVGQTPKLDGTLDKVGSPDVSVGELIMSGPGVGGIVRLG
jgi:hypothetical protein